MALRDGDELQIQTMNYIIRISLVSALWELQLGSDLPSVYIATIQRPTIRKAAAGPDRFRYDKRTLSRRSLNPVTEQGQTENKYAKRCIGYEAGTLNSFNPYGNYLHL